jgi:amidase
VSPWDERVWQLRGDPLLNGAGVGPLVGETLAVKDLYAVAGLSTGAGNPARLAAAAPADTDAEVVAALLDAGADLRGITQTEEFAYSLSGTNAHYGAPPNPAAPGRVSGGSSSGSATAVSLGEATIGLGTDTAGSIRVPASYQGLFGIRTTHGAVSREGVLPLAPSFDTVGWMTRDAGLLARVGGVLVPGTTTDADRRFVTVPGLLELAHVDVAAAVAAWQPGLAVPVTWPVEDLDPWRDAFTTVQAWEAWQAHGAWLGSRTDTLGADVRARFERASRVTADEADAARTVLAGARDALDELVGDRIVVLPATPTVAPELGPGLSERLQSVREATLTLTCLAAIGGLPAVAVPLRTAAGLPCGASLLAGRGRDHDLLQIAATLTN